ncbi:hypothetical protein NQ176_g2271 [Zarea fungicola]|uniref:Uncharacterized protein n=1 Tax=Zarea fungicola TaxID=93591 RepID=A0ACC1NR17_9HYPO|nr:hypothetical protein NQ176_g2271 [Lecanicillium fungicola]
MNKLSPEIYSQIASYLYIQPAPSWPPVPKPPFVPYAAISRQWQHVCEAEAFSSIFLKSSELSQFATVFATSRRRLILGKIEYDVLLPTYGESRSDHKANIKAFTGAVRALLELLKTWETDPHMIEGRRGRAITLLIHVDENVDSNFAAPLRTPLRWLRFVDSAPPLPVVEDIVSLYIPILGRPLHPATSLEIAGAVPALELLNLEVIEPHLRMENMRKAHRSAFARGLAKLRLPRLADLRIYQDSTEPYNHSFRCANVEEDGVDLLSDALRTFTQSCPALKTMELEGLSISPALLVDPRPQAGSAPGSWPSLEKLHIIATRVAPSGDWYYTGDPNAIEPGHEDLHSNSDHSSSEGLTESSKDSESSDEDQPSTSVRNGVRPTHMWRTMPDPKTFNPLALALATAVLHMPKIKHMEFEMAMWLSEFVGVQLECFEVGQMSKTSLLMPAEPEAGSVRRWKAWVGQDSQWEVPDEVTACWREWLGYKGSICVGQWPE